MRYIIARLVLFAFAMASFSYVVTGLWRWWLYGFYDHSAPVMLLIAGVFFCGNCWHYLRMTKYQAQNYDWYRSNHPDSIYRDSVACCSCGARRIHVRALFNHTYTREHFCTQCGKTLYYSPEGR